MILFWSEFPTSQCHHICDYSTILSFTYLCLLLLYNIPVVKAAGIQHINEGFSSHQVIHYIASSKLDLLGSGNRVKEVGGSEIVSLVDGHHAT